MNKAFKRYNTRIEIPVTVVLETIFSDDNKDVESLSRWALKHGFVDLVKENENDKLGYYKLQDDYTKQSFYILLDKEERKQYDYENFLCEKLEEKDKEIERLNKKYDKALELLQDFNMPCECVNCKIPDEYCEENCSVDCECYKKCWNKYIELELKEGKE